MAQETPSPSVPANPGTSVRLLALARGGDRSALEALLQRQIPPLLRFARGRLPRWARTVADTADLVQETLIGVVRNLDRFEARRRGALGAYLRTAVMNRIRDEVRRVGRRGTGEELVDDPPAPQGDSPHDRLVESELRGRFVRALASLSAGEQQAVMARVDLGYSYEQVALVLGKSSPDAARMAVVRALAKLAKRMALEG